MSMRSRPRPFSRHTSDSAASACRRCVTRAPGPIRGSVSKTAPTIVPPASRVTATVMSAPSEWSTAFDTASDNSSAAVSAIVQPVGVRRARTRRAWEGARRSRRSLATKRWRLIEGPPRGCARGPTARSRTTSTVALPEARERSLSSDSRMAEDTRRRNFRRSCGPAPRRTGSPWALGPPGMSVHSEAPGGFGGFPSARPGADPCDVLAGTRARVFVRPLVEIPDPAQSTHRIAKPDRFIGCDRGVLRRHHEPAAGPSALRRPGLPHRPVPVLPAVARRGSGARAVIAGGLEAWLVTRYEDALAALSDPRLSSDIRDASDPRSCSNCLRRSASPF